MGVVTVAVRLAGVRRHAPRAAQRSPGRSRGRRRGAGRVPPQRWCSPSCSPSAARAGRPGSVADGDGRLAHRHRDRRGRRSRGSWSARGPRAPTWCTAPARCSPHGAGPRRRGVARYAATPGRSSPRPASALLLAGVGSFCASAHPDGLEYVADRPASSTPRRTPRPPAARSRTTTGYRQRAPQRRPRRCDRHRARARPSSGLFWLVARRRASRTDRREPDGRRSRPPAALPRPQPAPPRAAHRKLLALVGFMVVVVATPREWYAAFAVYAASRGRHRRAPGAAVLIGKRMVIEVPFVLSPCWCRSSPSARGSTSGPVALRAGTRRRRRAAHQGHARRVPRR